MFVVQLANPNADAQKRMKRRGGGGHDVSRRPRSVTPRSRSVTSTATRPPAPATPRSGRVSTPSTRKETLRQTNVPWARDNLHSDSKCWCMAWKPLPGERALHLGYKGRKLIYRLACSGVNLLYPRVKNGFRTFYYNSEHRPGSTFYDICRLGRVWSWRPSWHQPLLKIYTLIYIYLWRGGGG